MSRARPACPKKTPAPAAAPRVPFASDEPSVYTTRCPLATVKPSLSSGCGESFGPERTEPAVTLGVPAASFPQPAPAPPLLGPPRPPLRPASALAPEPVAEAEAVLGGGRVPLTNAFAAASVGNFLNFALQSQRPQEGRTHAGKPFTCASHSDHVA